MVKIIYKIKISMMIYFYHLFTSFFAILLLLWGSLHSVEDIAKAKSILEKYEEQLREKPNNVHLIYALASAYYTIQDYDRAQELFRKAVELSPQNLDFKISLGLTLLNLKKYEESRIIFEEVIEQKPDNPDVLTSLGRIAQLNNELETAEKYYQEALKYDPNKNSTLSYLGSLRMEQYRYSEAIEIFERLPLEDNEWVEVKIEQAKLAPMLEEIQLIVKDGEPEEAIKKYRELLFNYPNIIEIYTLLGELYIAQGQYQDAINLYQIGFQINPDVIALQTALGLAYIKKGDLVEGENVLRKVISNNPKEADAYAGLGRIAVLNDDAEKAENLFQESLNLDPLSGPAITWYAELLLKEKRYQEAEDLYKKLLRIEGEIDWIEVGLHRAEFGLIIDKLNEQLEQRKYGEVEKSYQQLLSEYPDQEEFYLNFAKFYMKRKQYAKAVKVYEEGINVQPEYNPFYIGLAYAYLKAGELNKSYETFQRVIEEDPDNVEALVGLGRIQHLQGSPVEAEKIYIKVLEIDWDNITALSYLGDLKLKQKKYTEAEKLFTRILEIDPEAEWARIEQEKALHNPILENIKKSRDNGEFNIAEALYLKLIATSPKNSFYYLGLGQLYEEQNKHQLAYEIYSEGLQQLSESSEIKIALAFNLIRIGDFDQAANFLDQVLEEAPESSDALAGYGYILEKQGKKKDAKQFYLDALDLDKNNISALIFLGNLYLDQKDYLSAEEIYNKLFILLPGSNWINTVLQDIRFAPIIDEVEILQKTPNLSDPENYAIQKKIEKLLRGLIRQIPDNSNYFHRLGLYYAEIKRFSKAIKAYENGLKIDPNDLSIKNSLGFTYIYLKDLQKSQEIFEEILYNSPNNAEAWAGIGRVAELTDELKEAEEAYENSLEIDPNNITALAFLADLKITTGEYEQAREIYQRLYNLRPTESWLNKAIDRINIAPLLFKISELEKNNQINQAADVYEQVLNQVTDSTDIYLAYGNLYVRYQRYPDAVRIFKRGLQANPDFNPLRIALGIAYTHNEETSIAKQLLEEARGINPEAPDTLAGLGRIDALEGNYQGAEEYYKAAIKLSPDNVTTLSFYADMMMRQRDYDKAYEIYKRLLDLDPEASWVKIGLKSAQYGSYADSAKLLQDLGEYDAAECRYWNLIGYSSDNPDYYLYLADLYIQKENYDDAEEVLKKGLTVDPEAIYLWRALGYLYLTKENLICARKVFLFLLSINPNDAHAWAGLGRVHALKGRYCTSEGYYTRSLCLSSKNTTAINYFALGREEQERYFDAKNIYRGLAKLLPEQKWVEEAYTYACRQTRPRFNLQGRYHEEKEWNKDSEEWVARYQVYGGNTWVTYPINNRLWLTGFAAADYYRLTNTEDDFTIYFFEVLRSRFDAKWVFNTCNSIEASLGLSAYDCFRKGNFRQGHDVNPEPTCLWVYRKPKVRGVFGFASETDLVGRDFERNVAKMIARYYVYGSYEKEVMKNFHTGVEGDYSVYNDYVHNKSQFARAWAQWRPKQLLELLTVRYFFQYRSFDKVIPDYYTYAPQLTHQLQFELSRKWEDIAYFALGYAHGYIDARTRFSQIVIGVPVPQPFFNDRRSYNDYYANIRFSQNCFSVDLKGDYHKESNRYTIFNIFLTLQWRF